LATLKTSTRVAAWIPCSKGGSERSAESRYSIQGNAGER